MSSKSPAIAFALCAMSLDALPVGLIISVVPALVKTLPGAPFLVTAACALAAAWLIGGLSVKRAGAH